MTAPVILVEATPRRATDGQPVTVRLAGGGGAFPYFYGGAHWLAGLAGLPDATASLAFDGEQLGGGSVPQALELRWSPGSSAGIEDVQGLYWTDAPVTVRIGPEGGYLPPVDVAGLVLETSVAGGVLSIALADQAADLKRAVLVDRFAGTGGIEGPVEWAGLIKSRVWGRCFNVPGRLLDPAYQIWCFGDPARAWAAFDAVRDKGAAPVPAALTLLAWQGSVAATFAALRAAATIDGGGVLCPSIACVKWWAEPAGDLRADVRGEIAGGYVETAPEIAARIVAARSTLAFADGAIAAAVAARPAPCGWRIADENATADAEITTLLADVSLSWVLVGGGIEFRRWEWGAPSRVARSERVTRTRTFKPVGTRKLGYRHNQSPMARGDLAGVVLAGDISYADGTPVEDLKPAEPGATAGAPAGTDVAGRPATSVLDAIDGNAVNLLFAAAEAELARLRTRALHFAGPAGEDSYTLLRRETTERIDADGVFAETFELLGAVSPDGQSFILDVATVRVSPGETLAQRFTSIATTFDTNAASIEHIDQVLAGPGGATGRALVKVDVNGKVVGTALTNDGTESAFTVAVDAFRLEDPATGKAYLYADDTGKVLMRDVEVDTLKVGTVAFDDMQLGAVQKAAWSTLQSDFVVPRGETMAVWSLPFVKEDTDSALEIQAFINAKSPDDLQFDITIQIDGMVMQAVPGVNLILDTGNSQAQMPITPFVFASGIAAGPHTISVKAYNRETDNVALTIQVGSTLKVVELRKGSIGSTTGSGAAIPPPDSGPDEDDDLYDGGGGWGWTQF